MTEEPAATDPLLAWRGEFPILAQTNYLISNSLGAAPAAAAEALQDYHRTWATRGVRAWEETWWTMAAELGDRVAPLLGAGPGEVVFQPGVTIAHSVVLGGLEFTDARPGIVTDSMHFPSILYLLDELRRDGARVRVIPSRDGISVETSRIIDAIDERTAAVCLSHVLFRSSYIHEIEAIAERARELGALTVIDGYQAVGVIPVDVRALGVDVYIGGCLKWLCGGPGAAFLWAAPEIRRRIRPRLTGWMAHRSPFAFEPGMDIRDDAWRFLHGTPGISSLYAAAPGIEIVRRAGPAAIRAKSRRQTRRLIELAEARGYPCSVPRDPDRRGGTVAIDVRPGYEISRGLKALDILCDYRPRAGIRLSPHFYTRDDELEQAIEAIAEILETGSWRVFAEERPTVT